MNNGFTLTASNYAVIDQKFTVFFVYLIYTCIELKERKKENFWGTVDI